MKKDTLREAGGKTAAEMTTDELVTFVNKYGINSPAPVLDELRKRAGDEGEPIKYCVQVDYDMLEEWLWELGYHMDEEGHWVKIVPLTDSEVEEWLREEGRL